MPLVSVVIPTRNRPALVVAAVHSVLAQTMGDLEVVVVIDGPDPATAAALAAVDDPRLRVIANPQSQGAALARNTGVDASAGRWIAFLDDDDEWYPNKLEKQLAIADPGEDQLILCLSRVVTPIGNYVWPTEIYDSREPIDAYLFERDRAFLGSNFIQTSSYLLRRELFERVRFRGGSEPHDDWDFLIRLGKEHGCRVLTVPEPLVMFRYEQVGPSLSKTGRWRASLAWIDTLGDLVGPQAHASFCLSVAGAAGANAGELRSIPAVLRHAFRRGHPTLLQLAVYLSFWVLPQATRRRLRAWAQATGRRDTAPA